MRAPEIAHHVFFRVASFLVSDNHTALPAEHGEAAWHGSVIGKTAVALQVNPICKTSFDVIGRERPPHMARALDTPASRQGAVKQPYRLRRVCLYRLNRRIK